MVSAYPFPYPFDPAARFAQAALQAQPSRGAPASSPARPLVGGFPTGWQAGTEAGATSAPPPIRPRPPVDQRPTSPEPPRRSLERAWLTWQMPPHMQEPAKAALRETLVWRAQHCLPLDAPETTPEYTRFGLEGEQLPPRDAPSLCQLVRAEVRQMVRVMEGTQSRTERNWRLAMHSIRLGQLCAELEQRGQDVLEEVRGGLRVLRG